MSSIGESNEQLALRIKAGEDVADNMLKLWQQNQGMIEELAGKYCHMAEKENLTLKQTAERTGTTIDAARRWQQKALRELRKPSRANRLRPFYETSYIYNNALHGNGTAEFNRTWTSSTERVALRLV